MRFHADSTFHIGAMHISHVSPCQDYADHIVEDDSAFLVVSDGCSTGGQTDVGSRLVAKRFLAERNGGRWDITNADLERFALQIEDFYATALTCTANKRGLCLSINGDGVIVFMESARMIIQRLEWADNTPFYPAYVSSAGLAAGDLMGCFRARHAGNLLPLTRQTVLYPSGERFGYSYSLDEGATLDIESSFNNLVGVALFSDGITQIGRSNSVVMYDWVSAVVECLTFKNTTGDFVKRRVRRAIQTWAAQGYTPQDDLSVAVLLIDHE